MDLDGDGLTDILSGGYRGGNLWLFSRRKDGTFAAGEEVKDRAGTKISVGSRSVPCACDWDGDGDLDLIVGNLRGKVVLFRNESTGTGNLFAPAIPLQAGGKPLAPGSYAAPTVADWDGDGDLDLIVGNSQGQVALCRNTAKQGEPILAAPVILIPAPDRSASHLKYGQEPVGSGGRAFPFVADWDGDGLTDLLVGDCQFQEGKLPDPPPVSPAKLAAAQKKSTALGRERQKLSKAPKGESAGARDARRRRLREISREMREVYAIIRKGRPPTHVHGWVWVFRRLPAAKTGGADKG